MWLYSCGWYKRNLEHPFQLFLFQKPFPVTIHFQQPFYGTDCLWWFAHFFLPIPSLPLYLLRTFFSSPCCRESLPGDKNFGLCTAASGRKKIRPSVDFLKVQATQEHFFKGKYFKAWGWCVDFRHEYTGLLLIISEVSISIKIEFNLLREHFKLMYSSAFTIWLLHKTISKKVLELTQESIHIQKARMKNNYSGYHHLTGFSETNLVPSHCKFLFPIQVG